MPKARPYHHIPIFDSGEPLVQIPLGKFAVISPHPYQQVGARYPGYSPYHLRQGVVDRLLLAQEYLQTQQPGWRLAIFDGYRPVAVQKFMVDYTFGEIVQAKGWQREGLTPVQEESLWELVHQIWAVPNQNPATPPPHSTGGAVDLALADTTGAIVNFGSPIDEISERSHPDHYQQDHYQQGSRGQAYHQRRLLLKAVMGEAGFQRHPGEWWHFCYGDQMWAWLAEATTAIYGRVEE